MRIADLASVASTAAKFASTSARSRHAKPTAAGVLSLLLHTTIGLIFFRQGDTTGELMSSPTQSFPIMLERIADPQPTNRSTGAIHKDEASVAQEQQQPAPDNTSFATVVPEALQHTLDIDEPILSIEAEAPDVASLATLEPMVEPAPRVEARPAPRKTEIPDAQRAMLMRRIMDVTTSLASSNESEVSWSEGARQYKAVLKRDSIADSMELEQVAVRITASDSNGSSLQTQLAMKRLAFSHFTQMIDRWDADVQMHDDEIVGRFHSNSTFFVGADYAGTPRFSGKVTTAGNASRMFTSGSRRRRAEMFQAGLETNTGRIELPSQSRPFELAPIDRDAFVQTLAHDAHIAFNSDGSYVWRDRKTGVEKQDRYPDDLPTYFIAADGVTLYVKGTVNGRVHIYSPVRIVIEGNLTYASDPRTVNGADDYLGLVSDRVVEVARPSITGRGDLTIEAAIFARRRFSVTNIEHRNAGTLHIYGSLASGSISATEPRYATRIEFDPRFDRVRPPAFPGTNRYEVASWEPAWTEVTDASN